MLELKDSLQFLKEQKEFDTNIIYADPPYALGSKIGINEDGKVDYIKAKDFMDKWEMPTGEYWERWFKEAFRTLKHGGYCVMFGMDRQLLLFKYYAHLAGFQENQSLYWYYISNFPKSTNLSKQIDKNAGAERTIIGKRDDGAGNTKGFTSADERTEKGSGFFKEEGTEIDISTPSTDLAKKYEGYKYSISPLKQTNETIMVFQKPYKTGSGLHDTLTYENGDDTCCCGALDIDGNRVGTIESDKYDLENRGISRQLRENDHTMMKTFVGESKHGVIEDGRYPSQTFCDSNTAEVLDKQSGVSKSTGGRIGNKGSDLNMTGTNYEKGDAGYGDVAGCSKILHKCDFTEQELVYIDFENDADYVWSELTNQWENESELRNWLDYYFMKDIVIDFNFKDYDRIIIDSDRKVIVPLLHKGDFEENEHDLYFYNPKVSKKERNAGCDGIIINNHPTLKPIKLNEQILKLFKTPNDQKIIYPFAGSGSEVIGGIKAGFTNWCGCEINQEYVDIAKARIKHWTEKDEQITIDDLLEKQKESE